MKLRVLDPTHESKVAESKLAERIGSLEGKTIGFISNGKEGTSGYFTHLDRLLRQEFSIAEVVWRTTARTTSHSRMPSGERTTRPRVVGRVM